MVITIPDRPDSLHSVTEEEALLLLSLCKAIKAKLVVEIGTYMGYSAHVMALSGARVFSYDPNPQVSRFTGYTQIRGDSGSVKQDKIDLAFIDGDHSYEWALKDVRNIMPRIRIGGLLVMHDTLGSWKDGPGRVAQEIHQGAAVQGFDLPTGPGQGVSGLSIFKLG